MRGFWAMVAMSLKMWVRDRGGLFWGLFFPVLLMGLIGTVFGGSESLTLTVSVVAPAGDGRDDLGLGAALAQIPFFRVVQETEDQALEALRRGDRSLVALLPAAPVSAARGPAGPDGPAPPPAAVLRLYYDETRLQVAQAGLSAVRELVRGVNASLVGAPELVRMEAEPFAARRVSTFDVLLPGIVAMTLMQTGLMGVTWVISSYRQRLVLKRVLATPCHPMAFLGGLLARFTVVNLVQAALVVLIGTGVFGARIAGSVPALAALALVGTVTFLAMGFAISSLTRTAESANTLGSLVNFPMLFLSGTFWPRELIPEAVQPLVALLPLAPLVDAMRGVAVQAQPLSAHLGGMAYLLLWAALALGVATWRFRWE